MRRERVRTLLDDVAHGRATVEQALAHLDREPVEALPFAHIDHHRALRHGFPEVVFGEGKTVQQTVAICERIAAHGDGFLVTRTSEAQRDALGAAFPKAEANVLARTVLLRGASPAPASPDAHTRRGTVLVVTAGTGDLPVAEEAAVTLDALGARCARLTDVGVAGIHRLLSQHDALSGAAVVIVVAGMDGALPSVVGGLVRVPVIAVPTSIGYGASFSGLAALLTMLNSCAAGVTVCNIDNGFGAAMAAARIMAG
ncbi:MAG: nickel pincer cofactor biosynthesis protein LarB [Gemmatimonadetes bacterium]|nr:nickel pincer cofactor biosynthesis protein LarB [Gemmatimonadota bacterium]